MADQARVRAAKAADRKNDGGFLETVKVIVQALLIALVVRTFLFQPFNIPSGSLIPTLLVGDYLFVSKYAYGYSKHSFPFSIGPFSGRIFGTEPKRGDIAVFKLPKDGETDYIKRVIGLPGERVQMIRGQLYINGVEVKREAAGTYDDADRFGQPAKVDRFIETLPNGVAHVIIKRDHDEGYLDNTAEFKVPPGHFFMMGDNRDNSTDSRVLSEVGYVPFENFVGRAEIIFFSLRDNERQAAASGPGRLVNMVSWLWEWNRIRFERIFQPVR